MHQNTIEGFRLSAQQRRVWGLQSALYGPYHTRCAVRIEGPLALPALMEALEQVVARHEILRTGFPSVPGMKVPVQAIAERATLMLARHDLQHVDERAQAAFLETLPYPSADDPHASPLRLTLVALAPQRHMLVLDLPAMCGDSATLKNIVRELHQAYAAPSHAPEPPGEALQYADFAEWQHGLLEEELADAQASVWGPIDSAALHAAMLPFEHAPAAEQPFAPAVVALELESARVEQLDRFAERHDTTAALCLLACWQVLLSRLTGQAEPIVGVACDGRANEDLRDALGLLAKVVPLCARIDGRAPFRAIVQQATARFHELSEWQDYFFWERFAPASADVPFFRYCFDFADVSERYTAGATSFEIARLYACTDRFVAKLGGMRRCDGLALELHYDSARLEASQAERLLQMLAALLDDATARPDCSARDLRIVPTEEERHVLVDFNRTHADYDLDISFVELFERQVARTPGAVAVVFDRGQGSGVRGQEATASLPPPAGGGTDGYAADEVAAALPPPAGGGTEGGEETDGYAADEVAAALPPPAGGGTEGGEETDGYAADEVAAALPPPAGGGTEGGEETGRQGDAAPDTQHPTPNTQQLSYADLDARANQLAHYLGKLGVGPETLVGVLMERSIEMLVALLGILKAGAGFVPLDPAYPQERLAFMLEDAQVAVLLTATGEGDKETRRQRDKETESAHDVTPSPLHPFTLSGSLSAVDLHADWPKIAQEPAGSPRGTALAGQVAYVIYTSGSTGQPKGVVIEQRSLVNYLRWVNDRLMGERPCLLPTVTNLTFDASLKQLLAPLLRGDAVWIVSDEVAGQPELLLDALVARRQVGLNCVPSLWKALLDLAAPAQIEALRSQMMQLLIGGEQASRELITQTLATLPDLRIWNLYGPTEVTVNASAALISGAADLTIGRPLANTQVYILDDRLHPLPIGVAGELCVGGVGLARGYLGRPDLTAAAFIPNPFARGMGDGGWGMGVVSSIPHPPSPIPRLYRTGDLARFRADGSLEFLGRRDFQVKIRGLRIELGAIEAALDRHLAVQESVVLVRESSAGDKSLVAYVGLRTEGRGLSGVDSSVLSPQSSVLAELRAFLGEQLPAFMVPSAFVVLDVLPRTSSGKIDRSALAALGGDRGYPQREFVAPRDAVEEALAVIWCEILDIERVGVHDNFFSLGGHSLLATRLVSRIRKIFRVELPLRALFDVTTIAELAPALVAHETKPGQVERIAQLLKQIKAAPEEQPAESHADQPATGGQN